jgi:L-malate glycosyltransferase
MRLRDVLAARGVASHIFVETPDPDTVAESKPYAQYAEVASPGDVLVYQMATASGMAAWLCDRHETLVVNYHNITPPEHYAPWDNRLARHQLRAQAEVVLLSRRAALAITDSRFDEAELRRAGYGRTSVVPPAAALPPFFEVSPNGRSAGPGVAQPDRGPTPAQRWVSVGRIAPNKAFEHAIAGLLVTRRHHDAHATLDIVGRPVVRSYARALRRYADELGLHEAVTLHGAAGDATLHELLDAADVVVLTSEHEGFGVPAVEAFASGVPVVANQAGALPEIVGDAGVLVDPRDPYALAEGVAAALESRRDDDRRAAGLEAAHRRLGELDLATAADRAVDLISAL